MRVVVNGNVSSNIIVAVTFKIMYDDPWIHYPIACCGFNEKSLQKVGAFRSSWPPEKTVKTEHQHQCCDITFNITD